MMQCDLCWFEIEDDEPIMILGGSDKAGHIQCMLLYITENEMELT